MKTFRLSVLTVALMACGCGVAFAEQVNSKGFIEDGHLKLMNRSIYFNRQVDGDGHGAKPNNNRDPRDWSYGILANYESGFTQGTVEFGIDAFGYLGLKLDGGDGHTGTGDVQVNSKGDAQDEYSKAGAAIKIQFSNTIVKYGEMQPTAPVFAAGGSRLLPQSTRGLNIISNEINNLSFDIGHFTAGTEPTSTSTNGGIWATYAGIEAQQVDYIGAAYQLSDNANVSLYGAEFEDIWRQYYANLNYALPLQRDQALTFDFNIYRTDDAGRADAGVINNTTWSLAAAYSLGAHTFTVAHQRVHGDTPFDYVGFGNNGAGAGGNSIFLANSIQWSDFNGPNEKSWQARYDLSMDPYGIPGLSFMTRYIYGYDISSSSNRHYSAWDAADNAKHSEVNFEAKYVVQGGPAKDLSLRLRQAWHNAQDGQPDGDITETRLIADYPIEIF